jgi:hypothetical protein
VERRRERPGKREKRCRYCSLLRGGGGNEPVVIVTNRIEESFYLLPRLGMDIWILDAAD